jgi:glycosyltransferase involved in cell wall biosynthesis
MDIQYTGDVFRNQSRGGVSRYFCEIATRIDAMDGVTAHINAPIHFNLHLRESKFRTRNHYFPISTRIFGVNRRVTEISEALEKERSKEQKVDLVHLTSFKNFDRNIKAPKIVTIFDLVREKEDKSGERFRLLNSIIKHQGLVITISESTKSEILENFDIHEDLVRVTYLGVSNSLKRERKVMNAQDKNPYILFVGQRGGYKNFERFLFAFAKGNEIRRQFKVIVAGGGSFSRKERELIHQLGLTRLVKQKNVTDSTLSEMYRNARAFIFPSLTEGFGLPIIEAIYAGTQVVCSDIPVFREIGVDMPIYFDPFSVDSIHSGLLRALASPESDSIPNQVMTDLSRFSWDKCAQDTYKTYGDYLNLKKP